MSKDLEYWVKRKGLVRLNIGDISIPGNVRYAKPEDFEALGEEYIGSTRYVFQTEHKQRIRVTADGKKDKVTGDQARGILSMRQEDFTGKEHILQRYGN